MKLATHTNQELPVLLKRDDKDTLRKPGTSLSDFVRVLVFFYCCC